MKVLDENIWIIDGEAVPFFGFPYTTRMTIVRLSCGGLWVHSPIPIDDQTRKKIDLLGAVKYLIAPNKLHHLFIEAWQGHYPDAKLFGTRELIKKRSDISFDGTLTQDLETPWQKDLLNLLFTGSSEMEEFVFFHKSSKTLIVADLIENFSPGVFGPIRRSVAKLAGILSPNGKMPLDWRLTFMFRKPEAREHLNRMLAWKPERIVMSHGLIVDNEATSFLRRSFHWLGLNKSEI